MLPINEMNQLFLATHPDVRRKIRAEYRKAHPAVIVMAIKPKYAKAIYEGRKNWEFRKAPPPIWSEPVPWISIIRIPTPRKVSQKERRKKARYRRSQGIRTKGGK